VKKVQTMPKRKNGGSDHIPLSGSGVYGRPRDVEGGIIPKSKRGKFGETWWADRWIGVLEGFGWGSRLERGRTYARRGQTLSLKVEPGKISAKVQGSRVQPYDVTITYPTLQPKTWEKVMDSLASKAVFAAKLLAGDMPHEIEEAFHAAGTWLFPKSEREIGGECSCPDAVRPCKHLAAVHFMVAEAFDDDPFLLFTLRGRTKDEVVAALRERRAAAAPEPTPASGGSGTTAVARPIDEPVILDAERFFDLRADLPHDSVALDPANPAVTTLGPLKLDGRDDVLPVLETIVARVRNGALALAFASKDSKDAGASG
jgi:uncharacterized Zn finger protein